MTPAQFHEFAIRPALQLLPAEMDTPEARAMVLAIGLQESKLIARRQIGGPARGYPQFEYVGVSGVLRHETTQAHAERLCEQLDVPSMVGTVHAALEYQDVLAAGFARLLLWTAPWRLPDPRAHHIGWDQYLWCWRPGKPHPETWLGHWDTAWAVVRAQV